MNREIKFRLWLPTIKKMTYALSIKDWVNGYEEITTDDNYVWLQYTGLKDKNGTEIYEGDIVGTDYAPAGKPERLKRIIVYHNGSFRTQRSRNSSATHRNTLHAKKVYAANLIVIGNIYQHPNLVQQ